MTQTDDSEVNQTYISTNKSDCGGARELFRFLLRGASGDSGEVTTWFNRLVTLKNDVLIVKSFIVKYFTNSIFKIFQIFKCFKI